MIAILTKILPFLGPLLERFFPDKSRAAELQAEKELVEAKAFARGRISPRYLIKYFLAVFFALMGLGVLVEIFFPGLFDASLLERLAPVFDKGADILKSFDATVF